MAEEYVQVAGRLTDARDETASVRYFLYCHGIELALKAFLVSQGSNDSTLRGIGHDLKRALRAARKHATFKAISLSDSDRTIIHWVNEYYRRKEFEYLVVGAKSYPHPRLLQELAERLLSTLKPIIWSAVRAAISAPP